MMQQQQTSHWRIITYRIAKWAWLITVWIWTSIIIAFLAQFVPNLLTIQEPAKTLPTTWAGIAVNWLHTSSNGPTEILRWMALGIAFLLVVIPPLAFLLKQMLQNVQREGFDKLIDILQQDTISPQLEFLQQQLQQQLQVQDTCVKVLGQIYGLLQQIPTSSDLRELHTSYQQQQQSLQKVISSLVQDLQNMQTHIVEHMQQLYEQEQQTQKTISGGLGKIPPLLEEIRDNVQTLSLPSDRQTMTEPALAAISTTKTDHLQDGVSV